MLNEYIRYRMMMMMMMMIDDDDDECAGLDFVASQTFRLFSPAHHPICAKSPHRCDGIQKRIHH